MIVGIHGDTTVNRVRGTNLPLMNLHERVLSVLGCRHVDDVLIDAPWQITSAMVSSLSIAEVVHGTNSDQFGNGISSSDRYKYVKEAGIFNEIQSPVDFNLSSVLNRIQANQQSFQAKIAKKKKAESDFYSEKYRKASISQQ